MSDAQPELPLAMTTDEHAPPPADQIITEAKKRFVIPPDAEIEQPQPPERKTEAPAPSEESEPEKTDESAEATQAGSEAEKPPEKKEELTDEQREKRREQRRFERRLERLNRQRADERAAREAVERERDELRARLAPPEDRDAPKLEDFDYDPEKFQKATREYARKQASEEFEAARKNEGAQHAQNRLASSWEDTVRKGEEKYDDFAEVVGEIKADNPISVAVMESDMGADVAYYLAKNPDEIDRLSELSPVSQVREIGKIEAKLIANATPKPKTPSNAPAPITPVTTSAGPNSDVPSENDDYGTWLRKRQKQVYGARNSR